MTEPLSPQFAFPSIENCPYREAPAASSQRANSQRANSQRANSQHADSQHASCRLLLELIPEAETSDCVVQRDACAACCNSFPPTPRRLNPIVASLALNVLDSLGHPAAENKNQKQLREKAAHVLSVSRRAETLVEPLRLRENCVHVGKALQLPDETSIEPAQRQFECAHPAHDVATESECRGCRDWTVSPLWTRPMTLHELVPPPKRRSGRRVQRWAVGVLTSPRRIPTLTACLDSVQRAGWEQPHLFIDGATKVAAHHQRLPMTWRSEAIGAWPNSLLSLIEMIQRDPTADAYLLIQDDIYFFDRANVRHYLEEMLWPGERPGIVSLFCPRPYNRWTPGWHQMEEAWIWGAGAFLFSREAAIDLAQDAELFSHRWTGHLNGLAQVDVKIGQWACRRDWPFWVCNPSLAQHIGNLSTLWNDATVVGHRSADWFAGGIDVPFRSKCEFTRFNEHHFPCRQGLENRFEQLTALGRQRISEQRLVICALCVMDRHFLPRFAARVEKTGEMFKDYQVILVCLGADEATREFLSDWSSKSGKLIVLDASDAATTAEARNLYLQQVNNHYLNFDAMMVVEPRLAGGWSYDGIANTFGHDHWDAVGSYGLKRVSDFASSRLIQFDVDAFRARGRKSPHPSEEVENIFLERGENLLPIDSCFGGLALYRPRSIEGAWYEGVSEHAGFHREMRKRGRQKLYLNPSQITLLTSE